MRFFGFLTFFNVTFFFFAENNFVNCHLAGRALDATWVPAQRTMGREAGRGGAYRGRGPGRWNHGAC